MSETPTAEELLKAAVEVSCEGAVELREPTSVERVLAGRLAVTMSEKAAAERRAEEVEAERDRYRAEVEEIRRELASYFVEGWTDGTTEVQEQASSVKQSDGSPPCAGKATKTTRTIPTEAFDEETTLELLRMFHRNFECAILSWNLLIRENRSLRAALDREPDGK